MNTQEIIEFVSGKIKEHPASIDTIMLGPEAMIRQMIATIGEEATDADIKAAIEDMQSKITKDSDDSWNIDKL